MRIRAINREVARGCTLRTWLVLSIDGGYRLCRNHTGGCSDENRLARHGAGQR